MKSIKVILTVLALGVMTSAPLLRAQDEKAAPPADAQKGKGGGRGGRMTPEQQVDRLDQAVTLTAEQKTKVLAIYAKAGEQMQALAPEDRQTKGMEIRQAANKEVRALLTAEQQTKFDAMPQGGRGGPGGPGGGGKKKGQ